LATGRHGDSGDRDPLRISFSMLNFQGESIYKETNWQRRKSTKVKIRSFVIKVTRTLKGP
jgi:hypothetical protein